MSGLHRFGYTRDASWWRRPDNYSPKRIHRLGVAGLMAACNSRIMLDIDGTRFDLQSFDADYSGLCRRCFPPTTTRPSDVRGTDHTKETGDE